MLRNSVILKMKAAATGHKAPRQQRLHPPAHGRADLRAGGLLAVNIVMYDDNTEGVSYLEWE